jgi:hypothetical protein
MKVSEGDYLMAKKEFRDFDYNLILEKGKKYRVSKEWKCTLFQYGHGYYINGYTFYTNGIIKYFYTEKEERKLKLKKINLIYESECR